MRSGVVLRLFLPLLGACVSLPTTPGPETATSATTADTATSTPEPTPTVPTEPGCHYPVVSDLEFEEGAPLAPFGWKTALHRDGRVGSLFLEDVYCNDQKDIDWSALDVLVFIAIPAW